MNNTMEKDTITAISTPRGNGAISIIRMSGRDAFSIISDSFYPKDKFEKDEARKAIHGYIADGENKIDEVILIKYQSPRSYTGEDMIEINCHGGAYITTRILEFLIEKGARLADPGEFTKRAFINGKLDLVQAEAIQEMISSTSEKASIVAMQNLEGKISTEVHKIVDKLTDVLAEIDVSIDYPEYDHEEQKKVTEKVIDIKTDISILLKSFKKGMLYKRGVKITIVGKPNVGKSTFLNAFIGKNRAIVTDIPGTTRDTIEEVLEIGGITVTLVDTAGLRETDDLIENIGQEKTREAINESEIILLILDSNEGIGEQDEEILTSNTEKHVILVLNKIDMMNEESLKALESKITHSHVIKTAFINNQGLEEVEDLIIQILQLDTSIDLNEPIISSLRQNECLKIASEELSNCLREIDIGIPIDIVEIGIRKATYSLGLIIGENIEEEITEKIFSQFCLGK